MDVSTIRKRNLYEVILRKYGTLEAIEGRAAERGVKLDASLLSQIKNGSRKMGHRVARRIETVIDAEEGWMDAPQFDDDSPSGIAMRIVRELSDENLRTWLSLGEALSERQQNQNKKTNDEP